MRTFTRIVGHVPNLGVVREGLIYRSALPDLQGYIDLRRDFGIASSLNLMTHSERETVEGAGLYSIHRPIETVTAGLFVGLHMGRIDTILDTVKINLGAPILIHCRQGHDRTGTICAAWRLREDGWTFGEAFEECQAYGFNPLWHELKETIEKYAEHCKEE